jgi:uncharacterized damage-inducible protein DinB
MKKIPKPQLNEHALFYEKYIDLVPESIAVLDQLKANAKKLEQQLLTLSDQVLSTPYAPGKWSIKDIILHITDTERVFLYRAMRFARNDKSPLPFFDENEFAREANANSMSLRKILKEYKTTRQATLAFFANQPAVILRRVGMASNASTSVRACAWIICGHELHHWNVINERYPGAAS